MFSIYSIHDGKSEMLPNLTQQQMKEVSEVWVDLVSPTEDDIIALAPLIKIPEEVITDVRDVNEVPKLDKLDGMFYLLAQTPLFTPPKDTEQLDIKYSVNPLAILLTPQCIVTISARKNDVISYLETKIKNTSHNHIVDTQHQPQFVTKILLLTAKMYLRYLRDLYNRLQIPLAERRLTELDKEIIDLLSIERSLVYFNAALSSNYIVLEKLARRRGFMETEDDRELLDDTIDEMRQALEMVKVYGHIAEDTRNALSSLISNNLTRTVNWLTKLTLILMLPTLVGTFYGMNVPLPFTNSLHAFSIVVGISLLISVVGALWIRSRETGHYEMKK